MGERACDCKRCEKIGDAIIALDAPRDLRLEHTDSSFDYLCPSIKQPHYKHPRLYPNRNEYLKYKCAKMILMSNYYFTLIGNKF